MSYPNPTTGLGVAAKIAVAGNGGASTVPGKNIVTLSVSATGFAASFQLNPVIQDASGASVPTGSALTLTAVANSSGATAQYTGTITGGGSNALAGFTFVIAGFVGATNNGTFIATASSTTVLTLENSAAVAETHAATATSEETTVGLKYLAYPVKTLTGNTYQPSGSSSAVATVSATGVITSVKPGSVEVEVSYPAFGGSGTISSSGNPMNGLAANRIYGSVTVNVIP